MLADLVTTELINVNVKCDDWKEAINKGAILLEKKGLVKESYKEAIISNFNELGTYMVIAPGIVLSHARPESGVNETGVSIITLANPIEFGSELNDPVKLVITLASKDNTSHLNFLAKLMEILMNNKDLNGLINASTAEGILSIIKKYN